MGKSLAATTGTVKYAKKPIQGFFTTTDTYTPTQCLDYATRGTPVSWSDKEIAEPKGNAWTPGNNIQLSIRCDNGDTYVTFCEVKSHDSLQPKSYYLVKRGNDGEPGSPRIAYPAGIYSRQTRYSCTERTTPFTLYSTNGKPPYSRYVMVKVADWVGTEKANMGLPDNPKDDYARYGSNATWMPFEAYKFTETEIAMIHLGLIGASVFWDNYTFSKYGVDGGGQPMTTADSYRKFDPSKLGQANCPFTPNLYIDWLNGTLNALNANISGTIKTKSGYIGNYKIDEYGLTSTYNNAAHGEQSSGSMVLNKDFLQFTETNSDGKTNVIIGKRAVSDLVSISECPVYINSTTTNANHRYEPTVGLAVSASGSVNDDGTARSGNHAFLIEKGDICGFRRKTRRVKYQDNKAIRDFSVEVMDSNIIAITADKKDVRLNLPSNAEDGQEYTFIHASTGGWMRINAPYGQTINHNGNSNREQISKNNEMCFLVFDSSNKVWFMTYF